MARTIRQREFRAASRPMAPVLFGWNSFAHHAPRLPPGLAAAQSRAEDDESLGGCASDVDRIGKDGAVAQAGLELRRRNGAPGRRRRPSMKKLERDAGGRVADVRVNRDLPSASVAAAAASASESQNSSVGAYAYEDAVSADAGEDRPELKRLRRRTGSSRTKNCSEEMARGGTLRRQAPGPLPPSPRRPRPRRDPSGAGDGTVRGVGAAWAAGLERRLCLSLTFEREPHSRRRPIDAQPGPALVDGMENGRRISRSRASRPGKRSDARNVLASGFAPRICPSRAAARTGARRTSAAPSIIGSAATAQTSRRPRRARLREGASFLPERAAVVRDPDSIRSRPWRALAVGDRKRRRGRLRRAVEQRRQRRRIRGRRGPPGRRSGRRRRCCGLASARRSAASACPTCARSRGSDGGGFRRRGRSRRRMRRPHRSAFCPIPSAARSCRHRRSNGARPRRAR